MYQGKTDREPLDKLSFENYLAYGLFFTIFGHIDPVVVSVVTDGEEIRHRSPKE